MSQGLSTDFRIYRRLRIQGTPAVESHFENGEWWGSLSLVEFIMVAYPKRK